MKAFFIYTITLATLVGLSMWLVYGLRSKEAYFLVLQFYFPIEYALLIVFFSYLYKNKIAKKVILFSIIPFWIFCVINYLNSDPKVFNNYPPIVSFLIFIIIIVYYFFEKMRVVSIHPLYESISFWICVGLFIYFAGNFFYLLFVTNTQNIELVKQLKIVYSTVTIAKNIILSIAWFFKEHIETKEDELTIPDHVNLDDDLSFTLPTNNQ